MMVAITKPVVNGSAGTWGTILNQALDDLTTGVNAAPSLATFTTKGDLLAATGSAAATRLAAGTNGMVLTADSTQTNGLKYAYAQIPVYANQAALPASPTVGQQAVTADFNINWVVTTPAGATATWVPVNGTHIFSAYAGTAQNVTDSTYVPMVWTTTQTNPITNLWSSTTNPSRITAPWAGNYEFSGCVTFAPGAIASNPLRYAGWRKSTVTSNYGLTYITVSSATVPIVVAAKTWLVNLAAGDYVDLSAYQASGATIATLVSGGAAPTINVKYCGVASS